MSTIQSEDIEAHHQPSHCNSDVCAICLEDIGTSTNEPIARLPCMHTFHSTCVIGYFASSNTTQCPLCRKAVYCLDNSTPPTTALNIAGQADPRGSTSHRVHKVVLVLCLFIGAVFVCNSVVGLRVYQDR